MIEEPTVISANTPPPIPPPAPVVVPRPRATPQGPRPPVCQWFAGYCVLMAFACLSFLALGIFMWLIPESRNAAETVRLRIDGTGHIISAPLLIAIFLAAPFLPPRPWAWVCQLVLIAVGMSVCCCLPLTTPLLIYWIKPDTRAYFGMPPLS
jgi:hypothetical protein